MEKETVPLSRRLLNPIAQLATIIAFTLLCMLVMRLVKSMYAPDFDDKIFWIVAGTGLLLFAMLNSILSLSIPNMNQYWMRSILCYATLMVSMGYVAYFFSAQSIFEAASFAWIFQVLTFGYLLFLSMMRFLKKIIFIAQQEDNRWMNRMK